MCLTMWSELPQDIVESISKKFTIYSDYLRFRSVCRRWRLSVPKTPLHLPTQLPWLMLSHNSCLDLSANKIHPLNLAPYSSPETLVCGSSHGWLVILDETSDLRLVNPITLATITLPRLPVTLRMGLPPNIMCLIKVVLSASPSHTNDFTVFAKLHFNKFAFLKNGNDSWVVMDWDITRNWVDVVYRNGSFFLVDVNGMVGMVAGVDAGLGQISHIEMTKINFKNDHRSLVLFKEEMLLVIQSRIYDRQAGHLTYETVGFKIYKMNWNGRKWEQIQSLGEHTLFIGTKSSLCCCAADFVGCRPNCIYFTDYLNGKDVGIYSLSDESIEPLPGNSSSSYGHSVWVELTP